MVHFRPCCFKSRLVRLPKSGNFSDLKIEFSQHNARLGKAHQLRKTSENISENGRSVQSLKLFIPDQRRLFSLLVNAKCLLWRKFKVSFLCHDSILLHMYIFKQTHHSLFDPVVNGTLIGSRGTVKKQRGNYQYQKSDVTPVHAITTVKTQLVLLSPKSNFLKKER